MRRLALASVLALAACSSGSGDTTTSSGSSSGSSTASSASSSSASSSAGSTGGSGSGGTSGSGGSTGTGACNALTRDGAVVTASAVASASPTGQGGAIADGLYDLTELTLYTGAGGQAGPLPGQTEQETVKFSGNTLQRNYRYALLGGNDEGIETDSYLLSGVQFGGAAVCPTDGIAVTGTYTATATTLTLYSVVSGRTLGAVYTHR